MYLLLDFFLVVHWFERLLPVIQKDYSLSFRKITPCDMHVLVLLSFPGLKILVFLVYIFC